MNMNTKDYTSTKVLVIGAGPSGLACAITAKKLCPDLDICVIDKAADAGNHNLSGAVLEAKILERFLDTAVEGWREDESLQSILGQKVVQDDILFLPSKTCNINVSFMIDLAKSLGLSVGEMSHHGDYIISLSKLTKWMAQKAKSLGVEVLYGFAAHKLILEKTSGKVSGVQLVDCGLDKEGHPQANYLKGEIITADIYVLAEGCDGLVTENFICEAGLQRQTNQLYSIGVKEIIKVSEQQYQSFGDNRVIHALGYPVWTPVLGPSIFGGGLVYSLGDCNLAVGIIVGLDWKECDFNPQDALTHFKNHSYIKQFIEGGKVIEAGAKMIPEGGLFAVPRDMETNAIGQRNVVILGDSAGFVNMLKIKGLHNAIESGRIAAEAVLSNLDNANNTASAYTSLLEVSDLMKEMQQAKKYRQVIARFGNLVGLPLSVFSSVLPLFKTEPDYKAMTSSKYRYKGNKEFDKDTFTAVAHTEHREEQPTHLKILDSTVCAKQCKGQFSCPCITFCPAGVYEEIQGNLKAANASNCLHCKTCQRKCPFNNIRWTAPEGGGGPRYKQM